jgi:gamma-glutamyl-gamma-aminobutyrate hydrolase PuuD
MTGNKLTFCSLYDGDMGGSMIELLKLADMKNIGEENFINVDIIVFNGGADIGTSIYGEKPIDRGIPEMPSVRDAAEIAIFKAVERSPTLKVGICRGAQLLNCLNGGKLWQHVDNHGRDHMMLVPETGEMMQITSTHHQMMKHGEGAVVIGLSDEARHKYSDGVEKRVDDQLFSDMEILYYPATNTLCIQGHPEYVPGSRFASFCLELINKYVKEDVPCAV